MNQPEQDSAASVKVKGVAGGPKQSAFRAYRELCYGRCSLGRLLWTEFVTMFFGGTRGALGLALRRLTYPGLFGSTGKKCVFGRNLTLRHPLKIRLGDRVIIDDNCVIDAKGTSNRGIVIEDDVYIGRNTIVYCKNGDIVLKKRVNLSSNCTVFSSNRLTIGEGAMVGAYSYFLSGGEYDYADGDTPFAEQSGMVTRGELQIGDNCWFGARVTVLDAASIGDRCVIGAGAVVTKPIPAGSLALGVPARVVKSL